MRSEHLYSIMTNPQIVVAAEKAARRFSSIKEDQEEFINDGWLSVAELPGDMTDEYYIEHIKKGIRSSYDRKRYEMRIEKRCVENHQYINSERSVQKKLPPGAIHLYKNKWLNPEPEKLGRWYYAGEWADFGLSRDEVSVRSFYEIIVRD